MKRGREAGPRGHESPARKAGGAQRPLPGMRDERGPPGTGAAWSAASAAASSPTPRQLRKHICIIVLNLGEAEGTW